ncbi:hypothetical protein BDV96DRAFT_570138 [Lophiotrema nucula]|uniref:Uncharacterized protein n=1 Tax=Lophiotrema nucula TaxID=690887 RepID=A0A6A5ZJW8_9PLEO|nr:hypothetical protein BDV96DRAFT_570138 [Lophiotrema nucula]
MCYYRLYIFIGCGHSVSSPTPFRNCAAVRGKCKAIPSPLRVDSPLMPLSPKTLPTTIQEAVKELQPAPEPAQECEPSHQTASENALIAHNSSPAPTQCPGELSHPFLSYRMDSMCLVCTRRRAELLMALEDRNEVKFEEWEWKVKYLSPVPEESRYSDHWGQLGETWLKGWEASGWMAAIKERGRRY